MLTRLSLLPQTTHIAAHVACGERVRREWTLAHSRVLRPSRGFKRLGLRSWLKDPYHGQLTPSQAPQELQDRIYAYALTYDGALHFGVDIVDYTCYPTLVNTNAAALSPLLHGLPHTCKALRTQSRPLLLRENVFAFALWRVKDQIGDYSLNFAMQAVGEFFDEMGRRGCEGIRIVQLDSKTWDLDWVEEESMLDVSDSAQGLSRRLGKGRAKVTVAMRFEMEDFAPMEGLEDCVWACVVVEPGKVEESIAVARAAVEGKVAEFLGGEARAARLVGVQTIEGFGVALEDSVRTMTVVQPS
ncbi:hypothetical protein LTR12_002568 [Friedmanniomyces endolithicus]|nr:hypothetical protein LTR74_013166 [Friedmanniomyces endolithicus]KAK1823042.1 hypothetical protein LTR12_002568 [Friedmanniomyces endolithicus]